MVPNENPAGAGFFLCACRLFSALAAAQAETGKANPEQGNTCGFGYRAAATGRREHAAKGGSIFGGVATFGMIRWATDECDHA